MITVTPEASDHMRKLIAESGEADIKGVRISVMAGGCSGFSYQLDFEDEPELDDNVFGKDPLVFVDDASMAYIAGMTLRFDGGLAGTGLTFDNPKAASTCGCGSSFSVS
jgi:iron-sulfur cluster assembly protein